MQPHSNSHCAHFFGNCGFHCRLVEHFGANQPHFVAVFDFVQVLQPAPSWICYFKALSIGDVNKVAPINPIQQNDKLSTVISVLLAIVIFGETDNLIFKIVGVLLFGIGTYLMVEKAATTKEPQGKSWIVYALLAEYLRRSPRCLPRLAFRASNPISRRLYAPSSCSRWLGL